MTTSSINIPTKASILFPETVSTTRRRVVSGIAFAFGALLAVFAIGCSKHESKPGVLSRGNGSEPQDIDPQIVTGVPEHHIVMTLFEGLVTENPKDLSPEPGVAESWDVSEDGRTYTFHLRNNARWTDGKPVTAEDFYLSYKRILTPSLAAEYANMIYDFVVGAEDYYRGKTNDFSKVGFKVIDPLTLEVRIKNPTPYLLNILASHYSWMPVPIHVIEKFGGLDRQGTAWTRPENFVGNGAFRLKSWRPNQVIVVDKNPDYWDADRVKLNEIRFLPVESRDTEERMFRTGQLEITNEVPLSKIDVYKREHPELLHIEPWLGVYFYRCNITRPPLDDVRVRRALALAVDRESLVKNVTRGEQTPAYNFTPPFPNYHPTARLHGDLEEAKRLLAEAGYPNGKGMPTISILYNTSEAHRVIAEALQQMWATRLGVRVTLNNQEWKVYLDSQDNLDYELSRSGWIADYADPNTFLEIFVSGGGNNDTGWSNAEYDRLREEALRAKDDEARFAIYNLMEQILIDEMPIIPLYHYTRVYLMDPRVTGWYPNVLDNHPAKYISFPSE